MVSPLAELVDQHFFFLKVGPKLTFRMREAVFALARIEELFIPKQNRSDIVAIVDKTMNDNSEHWTPHYQGDTETVTC